MSEHKSDSIGRKELLIVVGLTLVGLAISHGVVGMLYPGSSFGLLTLLGGAIGVAAFLVYYLSTRKRA